MPIFTDGLSLLYLHSTIKPMYDSSIHYSCAAQSKSVSRVLSGF